MLRENIKEIHKEIDSRRKVIHSGLIENGNRRKTSDQEDNRCLPFPPAR